ncbi:MAG: hypothetical protein ACK5K7_01970 [Bacilli bacterium]
MKSFKQRREEALKEEEKYIKFRNEHEFTKEEVNFIIKSGVMFFLIILFICVCLFVVAWMI